MSAPGAELRPDARSTAALRSANQRRVLDVLRADSRMPQSGPFTQAEIARSTGLAPATVSSIVRELAGLGIVDTIGGSGRRGSAVTISRRAGLIAGIDIGHRHLRLAVGDLAGAVLAEDRTALTPDHPVERALDLIEEMLDRLLVGLGATRREVLTAGMGLPAPIGAGVVVATSILPGWVGIDARTVTGQRLDLPVHIDNDANLGALAEHRIGAGVGHDCMVYLKVSSGVGAGLILDGRLFRGGGGTAGEIGHLTVDENGPICRCGSRGCLEAYTSTGTVQEMLRHQHPDATIAELAAAAKSGDVAVQRAFEDAGSHLGWGVAMLANLLNPTALVIGGDMARAGDYLLDSARAAVRRHALTSVSSSLLVTEAALGDRSGMVGALLLALDRTELALPANGIQSAG